MKNGENRAIGIRQEAGFAATVYVVDDDAGGRQSISWLLESEGFRVQAFAEGAGLLAACSARSSGCVLLDVRLPGMSGLRLQAELKAREILLPVIFVTAYGDVQTAVAAVKAGAFDYIEKPVSGDTLVKRVRQALDSDRRTKKVREQNREVWSRLRQLTAREQEVMRLMVDGKASKVIAFDLGISERTVEAHRREVMRKMGAASLPALVRAALRLGERGPGVLRLPEIQSHWGRDESMSLRRRDLPSFAVSG